MPLGRESIRDKGSKRCRKLDMLPVGFHLELLANFHVAISEPLLEASPMDHFVEYRRLPDDPAIALLICVCCLAVNEDGVRGDTASESPIRSANHLAVDLN